MDIPVKYSRVPEDINDSEKAHNHLRSLDKDLQNLFNYLEYNMTSPSYGEAIALGRIPGKTPWSKTGYNGASTAGAEHDIWVAGKMYVYPSTAGVQLSVVSSSATGDSATGLGAQQVTVTYLTTAWVETSETLTLGGTTTVNLAATQAIRVNNFRVAATGTTGTTVGTVSCVSGSTIYSQIAPNSTRARNSIYTVPANKTLYVTSLVFSSGSGNKLAATRFTTRAKYDDKAGVRRDFFVPYHEVIVQDGSFYRELEVPTKIPEKVDIKVSALSDQSGAQTTSVLRGWLE